MAIDILLSRAQGVQHKPQFDLESLFYVLIYLCINLKGPQNRIRNLDDLSSFTSFPVAEWFSAKGSFARLGRTKLSHLQTFETSVLDFFAPYFDDLKPCVRALHLALCPTGDSRNSPITHERMIAIFEETLTALPEVETLPRDLHNVPPNLGLFGGHAGHSSGRKRSLFDVANHGPPKKRSRQSCQESDLELDA